jgi:hypothetical protein
MWSFNWMLLTIVLLAVQRGESGITVDPATCTGTLNGKIQAALVDMGKIARLAEGCTNDLKYGTNTGGCNQRVVLNTFQAYFGPVTGNLQGRVDTVICTYVFPLRSHAA